MNLRIRFGSRWTGGAVLWACLFLSGCAFHRPAPEFRFAVLGDSQFHNEPTFEKIVRGTELLQPDFVVHVGDMIHGYTYDPRSARRQWTKFMGQIAPLSMPFYPTPGNHDVTTTEIAQVYRDVWGPRRNLLRRPGVTAVPGDTWQHNDFMYAFRHKDCAWIVLDVVSPPDMYELTDRDFEFLKQQLEANRDARHIFVSLHDPLYLRNPDTFDWGPVHDVLRRYPVRAVFSGHSHIYDHRVLDGIHYFCLNSSGLMRYYNHLAGFSHQFVYATVEGNDVTYAVITDGRVYPPGAVSRGERARSTKFLEPEKTILIPDPSEAPINTTVVVPIENRAPESRKYALHWKTDDYRWAFDPCGDDFTMRPNEERSLIFEVRGPQGDFTRGELPRLMVESPYTTLTGAETTITYDYQLFAPPKATAVPLPEDKVIPLVRLDGKPDEDVWDQTEPKI